jgi:hypothetical protein
MQRILHIAYQENLVKKGKFSHTRLLTAVCAAFLLFALAACKTATPSPTPTSTAEPTATVAPVFNIQPTTAPYRPSPGRRGHH